MMIDTERSNPTVIGFGSVSLQAFFIMTLRLLKIPIVLATLGLACGAYAETKEYVVEVAVFAHRSADSTGEIWERSYTGLTSTETEASVESVNILPQGPMEPVANVLQRSGEYQLLHYVAWMQDTLVRSPSTLVSIRSAAEGLDGKIQVHGGHLLFADVVVNYAGMRLPGMVTASVYSIEEKRRLKLNETHYFDHPFFGVILRVSRHESSP